MGWVKQMQCVVFLVSFVTILYFFSVLNEIHVTHLPIPLVLIETTADKPSIKMNSTKQPHRRSCNDELLFDTADLDSTIKARAHWSETLRMMMQPSTPTPVGHAVFDVLGPVGPSCKQMEYYGVGDGEKRGCGLQQLAKRTTHDCWVISLGSNNEWSFEESIYDKLTNCRIATLDCTVSADTLTMPLRISNRTTFLSICLGIRDEVQNGREYNSWTTILRKLNVTQAPFFLKMDIEGFEWEVLKGLIDSGTAHSLPLQIAFELHCNPQCYGNAVDIMGNFMEMLYHQGGYFMIDRHDNVLCSLCSELLVSRIPSPRDCETNMLPIKKQQEEDPVEQIWTRMCNSSTNKDWNSGEIISTLLRRPVDNKFESIIVGLETWNFVTLEEIMPLLPTWYLPPAPSTYHTYAVDQEEAYQWPIFYIAANPSDPDMEERMKKRLQWIGNPEHVWTNFGNTEDDIRHNMDWINRYVARDHDWLKNGFGPHDLANINGMKFFFDFANSNTHHTHALYLETDAIPVSGFRLKFAAFLNQLNSSQPHFDLAFLGTCCDLELSEGVAASSQAVAPNVDLHPGTRCFNAVLVSRSAAVKVIKRGALTPDERENFIAIDFIFNHYIPILKLVTVWANGPLFYEENKISKKIMC